MKIRVNKTLFKEKIPKNGNPNKRKISLDLQKKDMQLLFRPLILNKIKYNNKYGTTQNFNNINKKFILKSISPMQAFASTPKSLKSNIIFYHKLKGLNKTEKELSEPLSSERPGDTIYSLGSNYYRKVKNNSNIVYKRKSITKNKKINVHVHKKNFSMNYYININTNLKNNNLNSDRFKSNSSRDNTGTKINYRPDLSNNNICGFLTKTIISNKKEILSKIIYIQRKWKQSLNEKYQNIIYDYKEILNFIPHPINSLKFYERNKVINMSSASNFSNTTNSIMSYNNKKNNIIKLLYNSYRYNIPPNLTIKNINNHRNYYLNNTQNLSRNSINSNMIYNTTYKQKVSNYLSRNDNDIYSYSNSNTADDIMYSYTNPNHSKKNKNNNSNKKNNYISFSSNNKKKKKMSISINVKNKLNKYVKNKIKFEHIIHSIDIYKHLRPNLNFITFNYNDKEELLILNNSKENTIRMPNIIIMKKTKIKNKYKKNVTIKESINENKKIINNYFLEDVNDIEPSLHLENKLIMKKPFFKRKYK